MKRTVSIEINSCSQCTHFEHDNHDISGLWGLNVCWAVVKPQNNTYAPDLPMILKIDTEEEIDDDCPYL